MRQTSHELLELLERLQRLAAFPPDVPAVCPADTHHLGYGYLGPAVFHLEPPGCALIDLLAGNGRRNAVDLTAGNAFLCTRWRHHECSRYYPSPVGCGRGFGGTHDGRVGANVHCAGHHARGIDGLIQCRCGYFVENSRHTDGRAWLLARFCGGHHVMLVHHRRVDSPIDWTHHLWLSDRDLGRTTICRGCCTRPDAGGGTDDHDLFCVCSSRLRAATNDPCLCLRGSKGIDGRALGYLDPDCDPDGHPLRHFYHHRIGSGDRRVHAVHRDGGLPGLFLEAFARHHSRGCA